MKHKVLIVEDDDLLREIYSIRFELDGFDVHIACDGVEGLAKAQEVEPEVIILDMLMPKLDGLGFLRDYQPKQSSGKARVIVASNKSSNECMLQAKLLGAEDYLIKSQLTPDDLVAHVKKYLPTSS